MLAFPVFLTIILLQVYRKPERLGAIIPSGKAILLTGFFWLMQLLAMLLSYQKTGDTKLTSGLLHSLIFLLTWTITVYVAWAVIQVTVLSEVDEKKFVKAGLIGLAVYLLLVVLPQLAYTLGVHGFAGYDDFIGRLFERHWRMHTSVHYDFYQNGSYVTSQNRVNGFEPEAAFLANLLGVVYLPLLVGLTAAGQKFWRFTKSKRADSWVNTIFALSIIAILLLAKTTTGLLTAVVAYVIWIAFAKGRLRQSLTAMMVVGLLLLGIAYFKVGFVHQIFNQILFAKQGTDNRLGGSIALVLTFLAHPFLGVGYGFTSFFILENVPAFTTNNFEYKEVYAQFGYPILSDFFGWFASFGLVVMIPALYLLFKLVARSYLSNYRLTLSQEPSSDYTWDKAMHVAFIVMIILAFVSSFFVIQVFLWPYLLMFFFYRKHLERVEKELAP